ncbi:MAG TPA: hypothetical protein VMR54_03810 [Thermoanaerobaculia bacterium]|nr:hypothetical protein [Thermoanaerobaculia bacterium]
MKDVRAVVVGLVVVVLLIMAYAYWQRPAKQFHRVRGYRVEVEKVEGDSRKHLSFRIPMVTVARIASLIPISDIGRNWNSDWARGEVSGQDILDAASKSSPGKPGVIERDGNRIEVMADGFALDILVKDNWDKTVKVRLPRALIEGLTEHHRLSIQDVLKRLDELGPGDVVKVQDGDSEVTITAEAK